MKKNSGKQAVINFIGQHPGCVNPMTNLFNQCLAGVRK